LQDVPNILSVRVEWGFDLSGPWTCRPAICKQYTLWFFCNVLQEQIFLLYKSMYCRLTCQMNSWQWQSIFKKC